MGLNICILSVDFLPNVGGIAAHVYELARALRSMGNDVTIVTFREAFFAPKEETIDGLHIVRIYLPRNTMLFYPMFAVLEYFSVRRVIKAKKDRSLAFSLCVSRWVCIETASWGSRGCN